MKISQRLSRRLIAGVGLATSAILLPTAALAAAAGTGGPAVTATPTCTAASTAVWLGIPDDAAAGHSYWQLEISNTGKGTCTFYGYPGVSALNYKGNQVGLPATRSGAKQLVTLAPGGTAHVVLVIVDPGALCSNPVNAVLLRVYAPGQTSAHLVPLSFQVCPGKSNLRVDAVHPGTGIPGYTIS